jgi:hypothetical protein
VAQKSVYRKKFEYPLTARANKLIFFINDRGMSKLGVSVSGSVPGNPPHKPFLCIFKHNEVFTYPTTAFSHKVGMDSGFPGTQNPGGFPVPGPHEPRTQNPIRVPVPEKSRLHVFSLFVIQYVPSFQKQDLGI